MGIIHVEKKKNFHLEALRSILTFDILKLFEFIHNPIPTRTFGFKSHFFRHRTFSQNRFTSQKEGLKK